ncbi:hypothetical protein PMAYCL1PPCAC_26808, partial [Pristionchus mayeri]
SSRNGSGSVATTTSTFFEVHQRATPNNLGVDPDRTITYCRFDLRSSKRIGTYMKAKKMNLVCAYVKISTDAHFQKCAEMKRANDYYSAFGRAKELMESQEKIYLVFFTAYTMVAVIIAYPIYSAWRESQIDFRLMRAYFRFR